MFTYNSLRAEHNTKMLNETEGPIFVFKAQDSEKDEQTQRVSRAAELTGSGLPTELNIAVNARVVLTKNIDVSDGLVNSAAGVVRGFIPSWTQNTEVEKFKPKYILVQFDEDRVGRRCRALSRGLVGEHATSTPIPAVESPIYFSRRSKKVTKKRTQFPLDLAWGVTIHKEQGKTEDTAVVCCDGNFNKGQFYTAISRTKELTGLHFIGEVSAKKIKVSTEALKEIKRMKATSQFRQPEVPSVNKNLNYYLKIQSFNINSVGPHFDSYMKDNYMRDFHIVCFQETWLQPREIQPTVDGFNVVRQDSSSSGRRRQGGLLMYISHSFRVVKQYKIEDICVEYQMVLLSPVLDPDIRVLVISLYNNPRTPPQKFLEDLEKLLQKAPQNIPTFVAGDFNVDVCKISKSSGDLLHLASYYGYCQLVTRPTHRRGGTLDLLLLNREPEDAVVNVIPAFYSDHLIVSAAVPFQKLF